MSNAAKYIIISPVRDEGDFFPHTVASVVSQTIRPSLWVIVNDGSTDSTGEVADAAARTHPWIQAIHRPNRGCRKPGGGVIEAFYDGYVQAESRAWDFIVKLDGDLSFRPDYFAGCLARFDTTPKLGIAGGTICRLEADRLVVESPGDPTFHVRGATKIYRRDCWEQIGGLIKAPGWDTVDELKANMLGWTTRTFPELKLRQHKDTGSSDGSWRNWVKNGRANYITGYHPLFMFCKCGVRLFRKPRITGGLGLLIGFLSGYARRLPRIQDQALIHYLRRQQINQLLLRKSLWSQ